MFLEKCSSYDGVEITYGHTAIDVNKPWLVFIIPFGLEAQIAQPVFNTFSDQYNVLTWECRLIISDQELSQSGEQLSVANHASDLKRILEEVGAESATLIGYCSGAGLALAAASSYPNLFSKLALVNGDYVLRDNPSYMTQHGKDVDSLFPIAAMDVSKAAFVLDKISPDKDAFSEKPEGIDKPFSSPRYFHRYALNYLSYRAADFRSLAQEVQHQVLVIAGEQDQQANVDSSAEIAKLLKNSEFYVEREADHYEPLRANSSVLNHLQNYLIQEVRYAA
jgi:pimeloyl-ACP methyl ester carboxylesterase